MRGCGVVEGTGWHRWGTDLRRRIPLAVAAVLFVGALVVLPEAPGSASADPPAVTFGGQQTAEEAPTTEPAEAEPVSVATTIALPDDQPAEPTTTTTPPPATPLATTAAPTTSAVGTETSLPTRILLEEAVSGTVYADPIYEVEFSHLYCISSEFKEFMESGAGGVGTKCTGGAGVGPFFSGSGRRGLSIVSDAESRYNGVFSSDYQMDLEIVRPCDPECRNAWRASPLFRKSGLPEVSEFAGEVFAWETIQTVTKVNYNQFTGKPSSWNTTSEEFYEIHQIGAKKGGTPTANFTYEVDGSDPLKVAFTSTSTDPENGTLQHLWTFGDGSTSTAEDPTHTYAEAGTYTVILKVTDAGGLSDEEAKQVTLAGGLVVNSTGDDAAEDAEEKGCTTGGTVGDAPECTLRAAIETANARGGGEITFDIAGGGVPRIETTTALPKVASSTTIDGTSQEGGWVEVAASGEVGIDLAGGSSTVTGLVVNGAETAVSVTGGSAHEITGNHLGTDVAGVEADDSTEVGVTVTKGAGSKVTDNVIGGTSGVTVFPEAGTTEVTGNAIGVTKDRTGPLGDPEAGVITLGPDAEITDNVVRGSSVAILVAAASGEGTAIEGNRVGVSGSGSARIEGTGYGIRVDGTPDVGISNNRVVADAYGAIVVGGSVQVFQDGENRFLLGSPALEPEDAPVTGGGVTIVGNTVGIVGSSGVPETDAGHGIVTWAEASEMTIDGNTIAGASTDGIEVDGGKDHRIVGNQIGTVGPAMSTGIELFDADTATVGGPGDQGNTIVAEDGGIVLRDATTTARVEGNTVTSVGPAHTGVRADAEALDPTIIGNVLDGGKVGMDLDPKGATVSGNVVKGQEVLGIDTAGDGTTISANSVTSSGDGIATGGTDVAISTNRVGLANGSDTVVGNPGRGIRVVNGAATVTRNLVAGSGSDGISVEGSANAVLRSNRVWQSAGDPIAVADGPDAPTLAAAIRTGSGDSLRTTLLIEDLPAGDAGTIEVFANDSCDDPEARYLLEINRVKKADEEARIIQVRGNASRDHYTVTYTHTDGRTSELSNCIDRGDYDDGDGDGAVDPLDAVLGFDDDPTKAIIATDSEQLLLVGVAPFDPEAQEGGGQLEGLEITDDPAPGTHPPGWSLPYGAIRFRITGLEPGGFTTVVMSSLTGDSPIAGTGYWKYGPQVTGGPQAWYDFTVDEETGTGAVLSDALDIPGVGIRRAFALRLGDGVRGDSDGGANGSITDPGGPVVLTDVPPPTTTTTTTPTSTTTSTPTTTSTSNVAPTGPVTPTPPGSGSGAGPAVDDGELARTGSDPWGLVAVGSVLLVAGTLLLRATRRPRARLA